MVDRRPSSVVGRRHNGIHHVARRVLHTFVRTKRVDKLEDRAQSILRTADTYSRAARYLNAVVENDPSQLLPSLVNAALALELYFKSLYFIEKKQDFKINGRHSHDFHALFNELSVELKNKLQIEFQTIMKPRDMKDVRAIESASEVKVPLDLTGNLESWSDVFTKVRYIHDKPNKAKPMMFFPEIEQAVKNAIFSLRPELQS